MPQSEGDKRRQLRRLLKCLGYGDWIRKIPGLEPRTRRGFDYDFVLEPVEYCVRYLVPATLSAAKQYAKSPA
jgi:hypothetical protein